MNILIVPSWYTGYDNVEGNEGIFHYEQAAEMSREHNVAIYFPFDRAMPQNFSVEKERDILTFRSKYVRSQRIRNRIRIYKAFKAVFNKFKPDIVHTHVATEAGRYAALWCSFFHIPFIVTEHSTVEVSGVELQSVARLYANYVYKLSKANFCVSEDLQNKLSSIFPKYSFKVMYNGISMPPVFESVNKYRKEDCCNIALVASFYDKKIKGIQFLLPALQRLIEEKQSVILHLLGGGEYEVYYKEMAAKLEIAEYVIFYGECEKRKVYEVVKQMDFLVSASLVESFGCSLAEALLLGKPVLATRCGGPEGFVNKNVGVLVEKGSVQALYDGIIEMMRRKDEFQRNDIYYYAMERFNIEMICRKYVEVYQQNMRATGSYSNN